MKKLFITFAIIIASSSGFSQSFLVDSKSITVPRYANQTAITAAITAPTVGMLVYNNATNQYAYWNSTAWTNFPTSGGGGSGGTTLWQLDATNRLEVAGTPTPVGVDVPSLTVTGFTKLSDDATTTVAGITSSSPAIKHKLLTGTLTAALTTETAVSLTTNIPHGIANFDKIIDVQVIVKSNVTTATSSFDLLVPSGFNDDRPSPGGTNGFEYTYLVSSTNISIIRNNGNSDKLSRLSPPGTTGFQYAAPYRILITYTN